MKGSVEGLYHLATSPVATIEGFVEFLENIDELPGLLAASLEELEGMDPEQQGEAIAKFITEQVFTFANPVSKTKLLQQAAKTKLGAAAVKVGAKTNKISKRIPEILSGKISEGKFLNCAEKYLGEGYKEISKGRFISSDGLRQVRYGVHEVTSSVHHAHFEVYDKIGGKVVENARVLITP
jgi:hypothetical protein